MKLADAIARLDTSPANTADAAVEPFEKALGLDTGLSWDNAFAARMKKHWLSKWYCTDSWVGIAVYSLDGEPVAVSRQMARRADEDLEFLSKDVGENIRAFIPSLAEKVEIPVADLAQDIGDGYTVNYGSELLTKHGFHQGEPVEVIARWTGDYSAPSEQWHLVTVRRPDGSTKQIHLNDFVIPFCLAEAEEPDQTYMPGL